MKRNVGAGSLYRQPGCQRWTIQYYVDGRRVKESTGTTNKRRAQEVLTERLAKVRRGEWAALRKPPRISELYTALEDHTRLHGTLRALRDLRTRWGKPEGGALRRWHGHLADEFADMLANSLSPELLNAYAQRRREQGAANATINREFAALRRMFNLAHQNNRIALVPHFRMLPEDNARTGFIEDADFQRLTAQCQEGWLRTILELSFTYGWRREELLQLRVRQVNFDHRSIRLDPGKTKNKEGREVAMTPKVFELLRSACEGKNPEDFILTRDDGVPVRDFRSSWYNLCVAAGLGQFVCRRCKQPELDADGKPKPVVAILIFGTAYECPQCKSARKRDLRYAGRILHDMRRSAAKALRRAGVSESVIMAVGGWKTAAMFRRYAVVNSTDQQDAMLMLEAARAKNSPKTTLIGPTPGATGGEIARVRTQ